MMKHTGSLSPLFRSPPLASRVNDAAAVMAEGACGIGSSPTSPGVGYPCSGGKLLLEMNRILCPGGYFITSTKHGDVDTEEGMSALISSECWNNLAYKTDEVSETSIRIYQRPTSNDVYEIRATRKPPFCRENENQDDAWYTPIKSCLHKVAAAIEERGTDWPEEWPKRLEAFPD
ncbi:putative methyltransferase PMT28 [Canna indica]|uniref:Methyltransferase n=1 Tax=Canna indica TaxID=4628 RepID=A0AAQ3Q3R5_9LILI|nr:putative methyltransferase PMT28 [Canna indica]